VSRRPAAVARQAGASAGPSAGASAGSSAQAEGERRWRAEAGRRCWHRLWLLLGATFLLAFGGGLVGRLVSGLVSGVVGPAGDRSLIVAGGVGVLLAGLGALATRIDGDPDRWTRGAAGERATAALLATGLDPRRWVVLHDLVPAGRRVNLDHLVIGPSGVWLIDTKAYRAPLRRSRITGRIYVGTTRLQLPSLAWQREALTEALGVPIRVLVAVHGRGVPVRGWRLDGARVLPAGQVVSRIRRPRVRGHLGRRQVEWLAAEAQTRFLASG
jgi:hypothetical protein